MDKNDFLKKTKEEILSLLNDVKRPGIDKVMRYLNESTFFSAKCHTHHTFSGGLAVHSLGVYKEMKKLKTSFPEDTIRIVSLLHDICTSHHSYYDNMMRHHHGSRSVEMLKELGLVIKPEEEYAILKHMHRIDSIPSFKTYNQSDMLRHYLHQCDHRDAKTYPGNINTFTADTEKGLMYQIDTLLYSTKRLGVEIVIDHLHKNKDTFYKVPASIKYHNNFFGGLAKHSIEVYREAKALFEDLVSRGNNMPFGMDSIILCGLLHDVCKMDEYEMKDDQPVHTKKYTGGNPHGLKSDRLLSCWHLDLTNEERNAIIWHMGDYAKDAKSQYGKSYAEIASQSELVTIIHTADSNAAKKALNGRKT